MIDKFKQFVEDRIYNQLCYYKSGPRDLKCQRFFLTAYEDDFEYVKRQICHFIASWDAPIYVSMFPDWYDLVVEIWEN